MYPDDNQGCLDETFPVVDASKEITHPNQNNRWKRRRGTMRTNPFADTLAFLMQNWWPIYVFWLLLLGSIAIALVNLARDSEQRSGRHVWMWILRLFIGGLWWQQTLWKLPP